VATLTKTFTWDSDNEGFTLTESQGAGTFQRDTSNGSPTNGSLQQIGESGRNRISEGQALIDDGTWESVFGVPAGSTINSIQVEDVRTYTGLTHSTGSLDSVDFNFHIYETTGVTSVTGTEPVWSRNTTAADSSWNQAGQQTAQNVTATYQASNTTIDLVIHIIVDNANDATAQWSGHLDYLSITIDYTGGSTTETGSFTADAVLAKTQSGALTADAILLASQAGSFTADAIVLEVGTGAFTADAIVLAASVGGLVADAVLLATRPDSFSADAFVQPFLTVDAFIAGAAEGFSADAVVGLVGKCVWVSPANFAGMTSTPTLVFTMPDAAGDMHFQIELDTDSGFGSPDVFQSPGTGWEYWDGDSWEPIPDGGVPNTFSGNDARYAVQTPLSQATWYRRVRAGVIT
jgi:hypothetical protein